MLFSEFLEMVTISTVSKDIRVVIMITDWIRSGERVYDHVGIQDDYITRTMLKCRVEKVFMDGDTCIISLHDDQI